MKYSKLFEFSLFLGIALTAWFFAFVYWGITGYIYNVDWLVPHSNTSILMLTLVVIGTAFLTIGTWGTITQHFKIDKTLFAVLVVILIPLFIYAVFVLMAFLIPSPALFA